MSLLKWQELARRKSDLGKKINVVHDAITERAITESAGSESLSKVFKPVTSKLEDVIESNLALQTPKKKRRPPIYS